jgi:hypothetical protein
MMIEDIEKLNYEQLLKLFRNKSEELIAFSKKHKHEKVDDAHLMTERRKFTQDMSALTFELLNYRDFENINSTFFIKD